MAYKEDLGKVVGDKGDQGDSYVPSIINNDDGTITIKFTNDNDSSDVVTFPNLVIPYYVPYIDNNSIKFRLNTSDPAPTVGSIPLSTLKGEDGHIAIQMINTLPSLDVAERDTIYIKVQDTDNDNIDSQVTAYIVYEDANHTKRWEVIEQFIDLDNYYDKTYINNLSDTINNTINSRLGCILAEQQSINAILTDGIDIHGEELENSNSVIHVLSNEQVEDLKDEIADILEAYIREEDLNIALDENEGIISLIITRAGD